MPPKKQRPDEGLRRPVRMPRGSLSTFAAMLLLLAGFDASAVVLGEIRSSSRLGELLHAEIDIDEEPADRFDASCVKLYRPAQATGDLPWITAGRLSFRHESGKGKLYISSDHPLRDPVVQVGVQSTCPGSRVWRDYTVLVSPVLASRESAPMALVAKPPAPIVPVVPIRKIDRVSLSLAEAPEIAAVAGAAPLAGSSETAQRQSAGIVRPARRPLSTLTIGGAGGDGELVLKMTPLLGVVVVPSEAARDMLRIEYRLLTALHEQVDSQLALAEKLRRMQRDGDALKAAGERLGASAATSAVASPIALAPEPASAPPTAPVADKIEAAVVVPVSSIQAVPVADSAALRSIPQAGPEVGLPKATPDDESNDGLGWPVYAALGATLLGALLLLIRRRRAAPADEHSLPMHAPTIVVDDPGFSRPQEAAAALPIEVVEPAPAAPVVQDASSQSGSLEVSPVMELAEIMLSFGRIQGAAQTLQEYIEAHPKEALQPWIRLLEIYRSNRMRSEFETLAENLNRNFNVEIVDWDNAASGERLEMTLELLPHIRDQIDAMWGSPECLEYLQKLLHDNRNGERSGFALPVVKEILLLIDLMVAEKVAA